MSYTVKELARLLGGSVEGDPELALNGFAPADIARSGDLTFAENPAYFEQADRSLASAILVAGAFQSRSKALIRVPDARIAFAKVLPLFFPEPEFEAGVHESAVVDPTARVDSSAFIGPHCVLGAGVSVGPRCVLEGGDHVGAGAVLGEGCRLFPRVTLYAGAKLGDRVRIHAGAVIGSDGYGYVLDGGVHRKVPQVGTVVIEDDVEIGANVTIDRGALGVTRVGKGTKIDNLVQLGHNVRVGEHCLLVSQVGIAGSTTLGDYVTLAGQVGLAGHLKLGNRTTVGAQAGVMNNIPEGETWVGAPACRTKEMMRRFIAMQKLPEFLKRFRALERKLKDSPSSADPKS